MNGLDLLDSMGALDDELVESAREPRRKNRSGRIIGLAAAAALVLAAGVGILVWNQVKNGPGNERTEASLPTESIPEATPEPHGSYVSFIKYRDQCYVYLARFEYSPGLVGERLAAIEHGARWDIPFEELPDLSSHEQGEIYAVKGFDPEVMICMKDKFGSRVMIYFNRSREDYETGREILEERYRVSEYLTSLTYEGTESSIHGYDEKFELDPACMGAALDMIAVLDEGEWVGPMTDTEEYLAIVDGAQWGLVLSLGEFRLRLTLYEAGYARVMGTPGMRLLKFDAERVMPFFELLASGLHGAPVESTRSSGHIRNEALYDEPTYGKYFPQKLPEGYEVDRAFIQYPVNELTGEVIPGGARSLSAEYRGTEDWNKSFEILVCGIGYCEYCAPSYEAFLKFIETCPDEYVNWYFHIDDLTAGSVRESEGYRELSVYDENVMIRITSSSLTPEQMVTLMHECFGK